MAAYRDLADRREEKERGCGEERREEVATDIISIAGGSEQRPACSISSDEPESEGAYDLLRCQFSITKVHMF
jgi:hypothetical protein